MFPLSKIQMPFPNNQTFSWDNIDPHINVLIGFNGSGKSLFMRRVCYDLHGTQHNRHFNSLVFKTKEKSNLKSNTIPCLLLDGEFMAFAEAMDGQGKQDKLNARESLMDSILSDNMKKLSNYSFETKEPFLNTISNFFNSINKIPFFGGSAFMDDNGKLIDFKRFSSGEKKILYIFSSAYLMHLETPQFLLLADCIEYSLSCDWQRILIAQISQLCPNAQIIIATHSPFIMDKYPEKTHDVEDLIK